MSTTDLLRLNGSGLGPCLLALLPVLGLANGCSGDTTRDGQRSDAGNPPPDAGLLPDADIKNCLSDEGVRICGTSASCYEDGPACSCAESAPFDADAGVPSVGICVESLLGLEARPCGTCFDGQVCVMLYKDLPLCVSESLGQLFWKHGKGDRVLFADWTPYDGELLSEPPYCPPPNGDLILCGGTCGGCGSGQYCTGRSPTHTWGICVPFGLGDCGYCEAGEECLLVAGDSEKSAPALCVGASACSSYAAAVPGGALCK